jgi:enoyl-CoA hydratase
VTGAGRAFYAGLDLRGRGGAPGADALGPAQSTMAWQEHVAALATRIRQMSQPVIAAVNGAATGGGLALALAADLRLASTSARFSAAFVRVGLSGCDIGVSWLLPRVVGATRAFELMLTGRLIDADEAHTIGLVLDVVPEGEVVEAAHAIARQICENSPFGVRMTKQVMWSNLETSSLQAAIDLENRTQVLASITRDSHEAMAAFVEKRPPRFLDQ